MKSESGQKALHYVAGLTFLTTGIGFLYFALTGGVHGEEYVWVGVWDLGWGVIDLLMTYFRPQWLGVVAR